MIDTYFFVFAEQGPDRTWKMGPYISFKEAADIMMNHMDTILSIETNWKDEKYVALIVECYPENKSWKVVSEKVKEWRK